MKMECDSEKLINLIQNRPAIYNYKLKEHCNRNFVDYLWNDIARTMKSDVAECKAKWTCLRNSYARTVRDEKNVKHDRSQKKRWYLADQMSFMKDYMRQQKPSHQNNMNFEDTDTVNVENTYDETASSSSQPGPGFSFEMPPVKKRRSSTIDEALFLQTNTREEDENLTFFKGIIPDVKKLTSRNQRVFRKSIFQKLMDMLDEQEYDVDSFFSVEKQEMDPAEN